MIRGRTDPGADLERLVGRPLAAAELSHAMAAAMRAALPFDGWCLVGFDPVTGLRCMQLGGRGTERTAEMARNEALMTDVNRFSDLALAAVPAGVLSRDHPDAAHSFRLHEVLVPQGFHSELRIVLRAAGRVWGALVLFREDERRPFDQEDVEVVLRLSQPLTRVVRGYSVRPVPRSGPDQSAGVVAVSADDRLVMSAEARAWLDDLVPGGDDQTWASDVTRVVFDAAHAVRLGLPSRASGSVRTVSGRWMRVEASPLAVGDADVAVVLRPATVHELLGPVAAYRGLTAREALVLDQLAHGLASKQIARQLAISPLTVNGHLQALYRKCDVNGREELLASLS